MTVIILPIIESYFSVAPPVLKRISSMVKLLQSQKLCLIKIAVYKQLGYVIKIKHCMDVW